METVDYLLLMDDEDPQIDDQSIINPHLDATNPANRALVVDSLTASNIAFGQHRWFYGGSSPDMIVVATIEQWDAEIERGRPGDNLTLVSLADVAEHALIHVGNPAEVGHRTINAEQLAPAWAFLESTSNEMLAITRHVQTRNHVDCSIDVVWDPSPAERAELHDQWSETPGELWLFDMNTVYQPEDNHQEIPREEWTSPHGRLLLDAYIPDSTGRVPLYGSY